MKRRKTPESLTGIETSLASPMGQSTPIGVAKPPNPSQGLKPGVERLVQFEWRSWSQNPRIPHRD